MGSGQRDLFITDSLTSKGNNKDLINYPTFIYEKGKVYPDEIQLMVQDDDPNEQYQHENTTPKQILNPGDDADDGLDI